MTSAEFPGLGRFPNDAWWRFMRPTDRGVIRGFEESKARKVYGIGNQSELWLPGLIIVGRMGRWRELHDRVHYAAWRGWRMTASSPARTRC